MLISGSLTFGLERWHLSIVVIMTSVVVSFAGCARPPDDSANSESALPKSELAAVTDELFGKEVLQHSGPTVVLMGTSWCPECAKAKPVLAQLATKMKGRVRFREVDVERNPFLAQKYEVSHYPTLILFLDGEEVQRWMGTREAARLPTYLENMLSQLNEEDSITRNQETTDL